MTFLLTRNFLRTDTGGRGPRYPRAVPQQGIVGLGGCGCEESRGSQHQLGVCSEHGLVFSATRLYRGNIAQELIIIQKIECVRQ